jgi:hypothetical protein
VLGVTWVGVVEVAVVEDVDPEVVVLVACPVGLTAR